MISVPVSVWVAVAELPANCNCLMTKSLVKSLVAVYEVLPLNTSTVLVLLTMGVAAAPLALVQLYAFQTLPLKLVQ